MQIFDLEQRLARIGRPLVDAEQHVPADHRAGKRLLGRALPRHGLDHLAAPEDGDPVRDLQHLVQLVADEDDRDALALQVAEDLEEVRRLLRRQDRGRLVEDEDLRVAVERLHDLDPLLLPDGDAVDRGARVDGELEGLRQVANAPLGSGLVEEDAFAPRLDAEHDVLGHGHDRNEHEVLMDHADPGFDRVLGGRELGALALEQDLARVGLVQAVEDVHQRRLAGAVLAEQRVHFAARQLEVDVVVGDDARELLHDPAQLENWDVWSAIHRGPILTGKRRGAGLCPPLGGSSSAAY